MGDPSASPYSARFRVFQFNLDHSEVEYEPESLTFQTSTLAHLAIESPNKRFVEIEVSLENSIVRRKYSIRLYLSW